MADSKSEKALLLQFNITQTLQIQLTRLKVYTYSTKEDTTHKCHICKYSSNFKSSLKRHLRSHSGETPFACNLCNYKSTQRSNLNQHILTHTGEKHYSCAFCTKSFTINTNKTRHESTCKLNPKQCDPSWVEMQNRFKCTFCPHSTARKFSLKGHMRIHTGEKPFTCNICNQKFSSGNSLQSHIFTHTREKPHSCQFCKRGFADARNQKKHEKTCNLNPKQGDAKWVEEQKKFKCHLCKYKTITKKSLERHLRPHTGEKPFKCLLCFYRCSQRSNLHGHLRCKHITAKGYNCTKCNFATPSTSKLLKHVKEAHVETTGGAKINKRCASALKQNE